MTVIHSLRTKILIIVLVFLALVGTAFVLYSMATTVNYKRLRLEGIRKTVEFETEKANKLIAELEHGAIVLAIDGFIFHQSQVYTISETLVMGYLRSFPEAIGGGFWFEPYTYSKDHYRSSVYAFFDKKTGDIRLDETFNKDEYDYHNKNWYREIFDAVTQPYQVVWTKPYIDDSGSFSLMTTAGAGIYDRNGALIGVSTIDWEIEEVIKELTAIKPTANSFVLLCVPEQDYIISSTRTSSVVGASMKSLPWDIDADSFALEGVTYMRFGRYMDNGWLLSIQIPETEIFAEVENQNNRFSILIAISSAAMLFLAYYAVSKLINAPIKRLASDVSRLALGNLDTRIEINSKDELGKLAEVFNKMTSDLKKSIEENAHERMEKERISTELNVASSIQTSMLPCIFPPFPDRTEFDLHALMLPAKEVGGDFYDFYFIDNDNLAVVIADVSGKGVPAALFMVITKTLIKNCSFCKRPQDILESVNNKLCENNEANMFVTAFMGFYNIPSGRFVYVNAGHNPPLVKKHRTGYEFLKTEPGIVLAWMQNAKYKEKEITFEPGDVLYLYTDGVTEAMNGKRELFGEQRLLAALNANKDSPPNELLSVVKREVDTFADGTEQADDITMLALKVNGAGDESKEVANSAVKVKSMEIKASLENLNTVLDFVNNELKQHGCPSGIQGEIDIAVEEIFVNIANYAYVPEYSAEQVLTSEGSTPAAGNIAILISVTDKMVIRFEDTGRPYNPIEQAAPDLTIPPAKREPGGLGVFLVKKLMDNIEYSRTENKNVLVMEKAMTNPAAEQRGIVVGEETYGNL
ncbi:MAG: SpoIIE family protein phosphatase [Spirochaetaceae bacterium]|jgi:sigma-B regulation protein RsbU (phosphoserine phosphatase)|nr:SpoIIE family protein phosphatase [Spirochaetaceae bacterium]